MTHSHEKALRNRRAFTLVELVVLAALLVALGLLIAWGVRRTSRVASLKALRDMGVTVEMNGEELTGIRFENCFLGDDVMMDHVANLGTFQTLNVRNTDVSDVGVQALPDPAAIKHLDLTLTGISDESLKFIGEECPNLTSLDLSGTLISDEGLRSLAGLSKLTTLKLTECRLTDRALKHLVKIKSLRKLDLSHTNLRGRSLDGATHVGLKELRISGLVDNSAESTVWKVFPESSLVITFSTVEKTATLSPAVSGPRIGSPAWIQEERFRIGTTTRERNRRVAVEVPAVEFVQQSGGNAYGNLYISRVDLTSANIRDADVQKLYPLRMLSNLQLSGTGITDLFAKHLAGFRRLEILQLSRTSIGDQTALAFPQLPVLRELDLRYTEITDEGMKQVAQCQGLMILDVSDTAISDAGLSRLLSREFDITVSNSDDHFPKGIPSGSLLPPLKQNYIPGLPGLRVLGLSGTMITDKSIDLLLSCPRLQEISVGRTGLSHEGLARLRKEFQGRVRLQFLKFHPAWPVETSN